MNKTNFREIIKVLHQDRRRFLQATAGGFAALSVAGCAAGRQGFGGMPAAASYGAPVPDPAGLFDLPQGFSYRVVSQLGEAMADGGTVPDHADGMGCFDIGQGRIALVRNHELRSSHAPGLADGPGYARGDDGLFLPGGTTTIVLDAQTLAVERQFRSLLGTHNNCAGGITPWGTWLSCEEGSQGSPVPDGHGWVFEVPAANMGKADPVPLKPLGRFSHEAACVDPATGVVYMTEDRPDGLLYRFLPNTPGRLLDGGRLQALSIAGVAKTNNQQSPMLAAGVPVAARWLDLDDVESPADDLRLRGAAAGASIFSRGEGIWMGEGELYFTATNGGAIAEGQVFRLHIGGAGRGDMLELFYESGDHENYSYGDNLTIAPDGGVFVCEDHYHDDMPIHLRQVFPDGKVGTFATSHMKTELAGACFSPDGRVMFVNSYSPAKTLAITGPWPWL